jgi:hypothetical protein
MEAARLEVDRLRARLAAKPPLLDDPNPERPRIAVTLSEESKTKPQGRP